MLESYGEAHSRVTGSVFCWVSVFIPGMSILRMI